MKASHSIQIDRPVSEVFELLTNHDQMPSWVGTLEASIPSAPGPLGVGGTFQQEHVERGKQIVFAGKVLQHSAPNEFAFSLSNKDATVTVQYDLTASNGGSKLSQSTEVKFNNMMLRMMAGAFEKTAHERMEADLCALKALLEAAQ